MNLMDIANLMEAENLFFDVHDGGPYERVVEELTNDTELIVHFKAIIDDNRDRPGMAETVVLATSLVEQAEVLLGKHMVAEFERWLDQLDEQASGVVDEQLDVPHSPRVLPANPQTMYDIFSGIPAADMIEGSGS